MPRPLCRGFSRGHRLRRWCAPVNNVPAPRAGTLLVMTHAATSCQYQYLTKSNNNRFQRERGISLPIFYDWSTKWKQSCFDLDSAVHGAWKDLTSADSKTCNAALMTDQCLCADHVVHAPYLHAHSSRSNTCQISPSILCCCLFYHTSILSIQPHSPQLLQVRLLQSSPTVHSYSKLGYSSPAPQSTANQGYVTPVQPHSPQLLQVSPSVLCCCLFYHTCSARRSSPTFHSHSRLGYSS